MASTYFVLSDPQISVGITITEQEDGSLLFNLDVLDDTGSIGDLNGLFFDIGDASLLEGLSFSDATHDIETVVKEDGVTKVDSYNNLNGEIVKEYGKFDVGVQFGTQGMAEDDIQSTSFVLTSSTGDLTLDSFLAQDFAVRLTSVGEEGGDRDDSVKIGGTSPEEPTVTDPDPVHTAVDDVMFVFEDETFNEPGYYDEVNGTGLSLLENDTTDDGTYTGDVLAVNDTALSTQTYAGSEGGLLIVNAEGNVDFSAGSDFADLADGSTATTTFTYMIEGGSVAMLTVTVMGIEDMDDFGGGDYPYDDVPGDDFYGGDFVEDPYMEIG